MTSRRQRKVADLIHEELGQALERKISDPRLAGVTITAVEVTPDLEHAVIFYGVMSDDPAVIKAAEAGLDHAKGFMRRLLAEALTMRTVPQLGFRLDRSLREGQHIEQLLRSLRESQRDDA
jgi:ribosome-binding factor A